MKRKLEVDFECPGCARKILAVLEENTGESFSSSFSCVHCGARASCSTHTGGVFDPSPQKSNEAIHKALLFLAHSSKAKVL